MHERLVTEPFRRATFDYRYLVEQSYARSSALKLVGDRYQLDSTQRSMLYRGIASSEEISRRVGKLTDEVWGRPLCIDALNVLYTVANYLYGRVLFISLDGLLRDAAEVHGAALGPSPKRGEVLDAAVSLLMEWLARMKPSTIDFYVDEPVSLSGRLAEGLRTMMRSLNLVGTARTVHSADFPLKHAEGAVVATSDSTIIDTTVCPVCDLARHVLEERFSPRFIDLRELAGDS